MRCPLNIIGITGTHGAGKQSLVDYLIKEHEVNHYSVSGFIKEILDACGTPITRATYYTFANQMRRKTGKPHAMVQLLFDCAIAKAIKDKKDCVIIESLLVPGEVEWLKKQDGQFKLLCLDADPELRYKRVHQSRKSEKDNVTFPKFIEQEETEKKANANDPFHQSILAVMEMAHPSHIFQNNGTMEDLKNWTEKIFPELF